MELPSHYQEEDNFGKVSVWKRLKEVLRGFPLVTLTLVAAWYGLNVWYNIRNKQLLEVVDLPWTISILQLLVGWLWFIPLWLLKVRSSPSNLTQPLLLSITSQGFFHLLVHFGAVVAFNSGNVAFVQIVKSMEPLFMALCSFLITRVFLSWQGYASLLPIVFGVALASLPTSSFSWSPFLFASLSNIGAALRAVYGKNLLSSTGWSAENVLALVTMAATVLGVPVCVILERERYTSAIAKGVVHYGGWEFLLFKVLESGFAYYAYNEAAYFVLGRVQAISHAIINTLKRMVVILCALFFFQTSTSPLTLVGASLSCLGVYFYSQSTRKKV